MENGIWKFKLKKNFTINLAKCGIKSDDRFFYKSERYPDRFEGYISNGLLVILDGYEWDGCTPKFMLFGKVVGIPDFKKTYKPSLVHDFLIEYCPEHTITRKQIDDLWTAMLKEERFKLRWLYSWGVHAFRPIALMVGPCKK